MKYALCRLGTESLKNVFLSPDILQLCNVMLLLSCLSNAKLSDLSIVRKHITLAVNHVYMYNRGFLRCHLDYIERLQQLMLALLGVLVILLGKFLKNKITIQYVLTIPSN